MKTPLWLALASSIAVATFASPTAAQSADSLRHELAPLDSATLARLVSADQLQACSSAHALMRLIEAIAMEQAAQQQLKISVKGGFTSDDAPAANGLLPPASNHNVDVGITLSRGTYPAELEFETQVGVSLSNGVFQEDISRMRLSYDYYFTPLFEGFVFLDRLSDAFLNVDQRYEVGLGAVLDWHPLERVDNRLSHTQRGRRSIAALTSNQPVLGRVPAPRSRSSAAIDEVLPHWSTCLAAVSRRLAGKSPGVLTSDSLDGSERRAARRVAGAVRSMRSQAETSARKRHSRLRLALLGGVFAELEQATLRPKDLKPIGIPGVRTYRWEIRPTAVVRFNDYLTLRGDYYYKKAFAGFDAFVTGGVSDFRRDIRVVGTASGDVVGMGKLTASVEFRRLFDNAPPWADGDHLTSGSTLPDGVESLVARNRHDRLTLKIGVTF